MSEIEEKIEKLRSQIDEIDQKILEHLNKRAELVSAIKQLKIEGGLPHLDIEREREILEKVIASNAGPLNKEAILKIYRRILKCMKTM